MCGLSCRASSAIIEDIFSTYNVVILMLLLNENTRGFGGGSLLIIMSNSSNKNIKEWATYFLEGYELIVGPILLTSKNEVFIGRAKRAPHWVFNLDFA